MRQRAMHIHVLGIGGTFMAGLALGGGAILATALAGSGIGAWLSSMIGVDVVNSQIKQFEDAVNHPPVVVASTPWKKQSVCSDGELSFFVVVEDLDEDDPDDTAMAGKISLHNEIDTIAPYPCEVPRAPAVPLAGDTSDSDGDVTQIQITCPVDNTYVSQIPVGVSTTVTVEVSDLGFVSGNTPPEGAYVVQVDWFIEVEDCD